VGLYRDSGEIRTGLIEEIEHEIDPPTSSRGAAESQQVWFVKHFGCNVNLATSATGGHFGGDDPAGTARRHHLRSGESDR